MKGIVTTYLNLRIGQPDINSPNPSYYMPSDEIEIIDSITGSFYRGNNIWYKLNNNGFVWSGGVTIDDSTTNKKIEYIKYLILPLNKQRKILSEALKSQQEIWAKVEGVQSIYIDQKVVKERKLTYLALIFQVIKKANDIPIHIIPKFIEHYSSQEKYLLPTDIIEVGETIYQTYEWGKEKIIYSNIFPKRLGCSVGREILKDGTGTIGMKVCRGQGSNTKFYLLSCYHVLCAPEMQKGIKKIEGSSPFNTNIISPSLEDSGGKVIAKVVEGEVNDFMDAAIAELENHTELDARIHNISYAPAGVREVDDLDENNLIVMMSGRTSNKQVGYLKEDWTFTKIGKRIIYGVIMVTKISEPGDSGACVIDSSGKAIGIIVSGNRESSFVIPINRVLTDLKVKPCINE